MSDVTLENLVQTVLAMSNVVNKLKDITFAQANRIDNLEDELKKLKREIRKRNTPEREVVEI